MFMPITQGGHDIAVYHMPVSVFSGTQGMTKSGEFSTVSSSKVGTFSCWVDLTGNTSAGEYLVSSTVNAGANDTMYIYNDYFHIRLWNDAANTLCLYLVTSTTTMTAAKGMQHVMANWDIGANSYSVYVDGAAQSFSTTTRNDQNAGWGSCDLTEVFQQNANKFPGNVGDYWLDLGVNVDFTDATNREKFRSSGGKPVFLGADGSLPTGSAPDAFFSGDHAAYHTNKGSGGGMTEVGTIGDGGFYPA